MDSEPAVKGSNFFISYSSSDEDWATWIAWVLEEAGYSTILQAWDFRPGSNFVLEMNEAARAADRTIVVLTPRFLESSYTPSEWAAAFAQDPQGLKRRLIPVRVEPCNTSGLLKQIVWIDLVGLSTEDARRRLVAGVQPGRAKPLAPPLFPGEATEAPPPVVKRPLTWAAVKAQPGVRWRSALGPDAETGRGPAVYEFRMIAIGNQSTDFEAGRDLISVLEELGRDSGLFATAGPLWTFEGDDVDMVASQDRSVGLINVAGKEAGMWLTLPHDKLGSVLDAADLAPRVSAVVRVLRKGGILSHERYTFAQRVAPANMLTLGPSGVIDRRRSALYGSGPQGSLVVPPESSIETVSLDDNLPAAIDELLSRLVSAAESGKTRPS
jgi:hypothetical protein